MFERKLQLKKITDTSCMQKTKTSASCLVNIVQMDDIQLFKFDKEQIVAFVVKIKQKKCYLVLLFIRDSLQTRISAKGIQARRNQDETMSSSGSIDTRIILFYNKCTITKLRINLVKANKQKPVAPDSLIEKFLLQRKWPPWLKKKVYNRLVLQFSKKDCREFD